MRELTRGKRKPCRVAWMDQFIGTLGSATVGYLQTTLKPSWSASVMSRQGRRERMPRGRGNASLINTSRKGLTRADCLQIRI